MSYMLRKNVLKNTAADVKYLVDRGYCKTSAVDFAANHYALNRSERNFIVRYVSSNEEIRRRRSKKTSIRMMKGEFVVVDAYNVLITVESIISGKPFVRCMDGFIRDVSAVFSGYRINKYTVKALDLLLEILAAYKPAYVLFILDSQISRSGELSSFIRSRLNVFSLSGDAVTRRNVDWMIKNINALTLTSDGFIIDEVDKVVDVCSVIAKRCRYLNRCNKIII